MHWSIKYIDVPFVEHGRDLNGCDCWGLVKLALKEQFNVDVPDHRNDYTCMKDIRGIAKAVEHDLPDWEEVTKPISGDVVILRCKGLPIHVGVMIDKRRMLHIMEGINSAIESLNSITWRDRVVGYYRPKQ